jgi:hypothetical protein
MPGIAWGIIIIWGALTGSALLGPPKAWDGVDSTMKSRYGKPAKVEYRTWTSSPQILSNKSCQVRVFALVTREHLTRLRINGVEQLMDWSWSWPADLPPNTRGETTVEFIDPVGGAVLATHTVTEICWG